MRLRRNAIHARLRYAGARHSTFHDMPRLSSHKRVARILSNSEWTLQSVTKDLHKLCQKRKNKGIEKFATNLLLYFGKERRPSTWELAKYLRAQLSFRKLQIRTFIFVREPVMRATHGEPSYWQVPAITTLPNLALWLGISDASLHHLRATWSSDQEEVRSNGHYKRILIPRGQRTPRLIEAPFPRLKLVQTKILRGILDEIPRHSAVCGFRKGKGIAHHVTPHTKQRCVARMDLTDFFPSLSRSRVNRLFLTMGYPTEVADALADLCTTTTPVEMIRTIPKKTDPFQAWNQLSIYRKRHLPQGAPSSPALANLCAHSLDQRLTGLAEKFGAFYTRYADDLLFSGADDFRRDAARFTNKVAQIVQQEELSVSQHKTSIMPAATRQLACGLVLNDRPNLPRKQRELLEAILTNCIRYGPESQNRDQLSDFRSHLEGRIAHLNHHNPTWGGKLRKLFEQINWN